MTCVIGRKDKGKQMDFCRDFIQWVGEDMSLKILSCLDSSSDLVRVCAVSKSWRQFVISNGLCKQLCLRMFPETSRFTRVIELHNNVEVEPVGNHESGEMSCLEKEHKAFATLTHNLMSLPSRDCVRDAIYASSTDNYPEESITNTLVPDEKVDNRASYWSSKGALSISAPETLIYDLAAQLCLISEIHVHPFQAYFQIGFPIYSAKAVRFHMGYHKVPLDVDDDEREEFLNASEFSDEKFVWTYTSPEFEMAKESSLQKFVLPEPVLCIGGILKVELLGRVQTQEMDGLYYICIRHIQVTGKLLSPVFDIEMLEERGKFALTYSPEYLSCPPSSNSVEGESSSFYRFGASLRTWEQMIMNTFMGAGPLMEDEYYDDSDDDSDYE